MMEIHILNQRRNQSMKGTISNTPATIKNQIKTESIGGTWEKL